MEKLRALIERTGNTQGIKFKSTPPNNAPRQAHTTWSASTGLVGAGLVPACPPHAEALGVELEVELELGPWGSGQVP